MKNFQTILFMIFMVTCLPCLPFPHNNAGQIGGSDFTGTFELQGEDGIRVSIEKGWERNGRIPVVLSFGDLEISLAVNAGHPAAPAGIETGIGEVLAENPNFFFTVYNQSPVRTRMRPADERTPVMVKINHEKKKAEFYIGNNRLKLNSIRAVFKEIEPGELYRLTFSGIGVYMYSGFIFKRSAGAIYTVPPGREPFNPDLELTEKNVWAIRTDVEQAGAQLSEEGGIK